MSLYELIQQRGIEAIGRFYSTYRGIVISNRDPDNQNKVCVYIPNILNGIEVWAYPKGQQGGPGSGFKWLTPKEGAIVYIEFVNGDPGQPLWTHHGWAIGEMPNELNHQDTVGFITPKGNKVIIRESEGGDVEIHINNRVFSQIGDGSKCEVTEDLIEVNGGSNRGLVNIAQIESLVTALQKDLLIASTGTNLSKWMADEMPKMEDKKFTH